MSGQVLEKVNSDEVELPTPMIETVPNFDSHGQANPGQARIQDPSAEKRVQVNGSGHPT